MKEIWKDIEGWDGLYQVSNLGRVKSLPRLRVSIHPYITKEKILRPRVYGDTREYLSVTLCNNNHRKQVPIHRLVAIAFIPNPHGYNEVNHINEIKGDNRSCNLEWCSRSYNVNYGRRIEKQRTHLIRKVAQYDLNGNLLNVYNSFYDAAKAVGGNSANISHVVKGDNKTHKGFIWKRLCTK